MLTRTAMKVKKANFVEHARRFVDVDPKTIARVAERFANGDKVTTYNEEEAKVLKLMKEVRVVTSQVEGSAESRVYKQNEIRALMMDKGLPSFFLTVNPADVHNPIVRVLAGEELSMEDLCSRNFASGWVQPSEISTNPFTGAKFFHFMMDAFLKAILGYGESDGGVLGEVDAYYGMVEAQG
ncbi:hypothetical protein AAF712_011719 [Marasmius tenuissimus]|uniref:Helitron helicase-like domain-containing protein n=1 Tax=Marasmius tenuissimus TaxID=585030 RepID=A0ABR2ZIE0_9AGAR